MVKTLVYPTFNRGIAMSNDPIVKQLNLDPIYLKSLSDFALKRNLGLSEIKVNGCDTYPANLLPQQGPDQIISPI